MESFDVWDRCRSWLALPSWSWILVAALIVEMEVDVDVEEKKPLWGVSDWLNEDIFWASGKWYLNGGCMLCICMLCSTGDVQGF